MKTGFFGGAFDPFHNEHKQIVLSAINELRLDRIVVYPSFLPPHKHCSAPFDMRKKFVELSLSDIKNVIVDDIEKQRGKINPSCEILPLLKEKYPSDEYYFIIGGDSMVNLKKWVNPKKVFESMPIAVVDRENVTESDEAIKNAEKEFNAEIVKLNYTGKEASGSNVKAEIAFGEKPEEIDEKVYELIESTHLYGEYEAIAGKLKSSIPERTYSHAKRTVMYALKLNAKLGLEFDKVFIAALLHDCAKHLHRDMEGIPKAVEHQFLGAEVAEKEYGITDSEILDAIMYHTTGKPDMTKLGQLVYCADMLEEGRVYDGVEELRNAIEKDFRKGFVLCCNSSYNKLIADGRPVHPLTKECVEYYNSIDEK